MGISVMASLIGVVTPCIIKQKIITIDQYSTVDMQSAIMQQAIELHQKITSIILTFGLLFILSCFSIYNIYWRRQVMRDEEYSHEVERVPGMSDKPPPYDTLTFS